ncbi:hypothetical protein, partial [Pseudomonas sp. NPDC087626]|uniref:hypothetical protein n=1 Tax=Pseudomonas sp. NPDC087626 TaxID=3364444 RepID=UPI003823F4BF
MLAAPGLPAMAFQISPSRYRYLHSCGADQDVGLGGVHIHFFGNGLLWFRFYSGSLLNSAKVSKTLL